MSATDIEKKVRYINDAHGKHTDVIIPYNIFKELLEVKMSMEIYEQQDVKRSLQRARKQVAAGNGKSFRNADEAIAWLKK